LQLFKTDMCKFFLQSRCENGDRCSYAHTVDEVRRKPDLTRTSMCRAMAQTGSCMDAGCRFAHTEEQLRATHGFFKMKMCGFAQSGRCKHGNNCRFAHSPEELRPAKPPPPGAEDDSLLARPAGGGAGAGRAATGPQLLQEAAASGTRQQEFAMGDFIFGMIRPQEQQQQQQGPPPPPEPVPGTQAAAKNRRLERRWAAAVAGQQPQLMRNSRGQERQGPKSGNGSGNGSGTGTAEPDAGAGALFGASNESDSADGSSWASGGSSATEVPKSEHTGSPPTTSDSSSGNRAGGSGGMPPNSGGSGSASGEQRPKEQGRRPQREDGGQAPDNSPKVTTLLITNVPTYLTQGALLSMFEDLTLAMRGNFDFYYSPWDERMGLNLGYAILNFPDPNHAAEFQQTWNNKELCRGGRGQKPLRVVKASVQGLRANSEYFSKVEITPCSNMRFRPLYRDASGLLQPLPLLPNGPPTGAGVSLLPEPPPTVLAGTGGGLPRGQADGQRGGQRGPGSHRPPPAQPPAQQQQQAQRAQLAFPQEAHGQGPQWGLWETGEQDNVNSRHTLQARPRRSHRRGEAHMQLQQQEDAYGDFQAALAGRFGLHYGEFQDAGCHGQADYRLPMQQDGGCHGQADYRLPLQQEVMDMQHAMGGMDPGWVPKHPKLGKALPGGQEVLDMQHAMGPMDPGCAAGAAAGTVQHKDFWGKPQDGPGEAAGTQVLTWPMMMTPVPWPMPEPQQKAGGADGKGFQGQQQEMVLVGGADSMGGMGAGSAGAGGGANGGAPVQYQQMVSYMMMPMEAMGHSTMPMMPQMVSGAWQDKDEVYTD